MPVIISIFGDIKEYRKPKRLELGGWVELDYDAEVELVQGIKFYRECRKQSEGSYSSYDREDWKWGCHNVGLSVSCYDDTVNTMDSFKGWRIYRHSSPSKERYRDREHAFKAVVAVIVDLLAKTMRKIENEYNTAMFTYRTDYYSAKGK